MRSLRSKAVEVWIKQQGRKEKMADPVAMQQIIEQKRFENSQPYVFPGALRRNFKIAERDWNGMAYYVFNDNAVDAQILYLHGGGFINQPLEYHWKFLAEIADRTQCRIIVPIYPKVPLATYKDVHAPIVSLYQALLEQTHAGNLCIMGDSAGGGLALSIAQKLRDDDIPQPRNIILLSPWLDVSMTNPDILELEKVDPMLAASGLKTIGELYADDLDTHDPLVSPLYGSLQGLGHITLFVGTRELFLADCRKLVDDAGREGVPINYYEYPKMNHVFPVYPIPEAKEAQEKIIDILK